MHFLTTRSCFSDMLMDLFTSKLFIVKCGEYLFDVRGEYIFFTRVHITIFQALSITDSHIVLMSMLDPAYVLIPLVFKLYYYSCSLDRTQARKIKIFSYYKLLYLKFSTFNYVYFYFINEYKIYFCNVRGK